MKSIAVVLALWGVTAAAHADTPAAAYITSRELDQVISRTPDVTNGARLYETCTACHGRQGDGVSDGSVPAIAGQPFKVVARQLIAFRSGARIDPRMQHFSDSTHLSYSQEVADVSAFVSQLAPRQEAESSTERGGGRGAVLYIRMCERCHGTTAEGSDSGYAPRLAGQRAQYLIRQLSGSAEARPDLKKAHSAIGTLSTENIAALAQTLSSL